MPAQPYQRLRVAGPWAMEDAGVTPAPQLSSMSLARLFRCFQRAGTPKLVKPARLRVVGRAVNARSTAFVAVISN